MVPVKQAAAEFLAKKRIAVTGVSRTPKDHGSNVAYKRLCDRGYPGLRGQPNVGQVEGDRCYHNLASVPGGVEAVVIGTRPETAEATMRECADLGIKHVWIHRGPGAGSVSTAATGYGRRRGITVIDGGCPLIFGPTADFGHKIPARAAVVWPARNEPSGRCSARWRRVATVSRRRSLASAPITAHVSYPAGATQLGG
jgi:hypothetical protein